jgi:hypothetical protein
MCAACLCACSHDSLGACYHSCFFSLVFLSVLPLLSVFVFLICCDRPLLFATASLCPREVDLSVARSLELELELARPLSFFFVRDMSAASRWGKAFANFPGDSSQSHLPLELDQVVELMQDHGNGWWTARTLEDPPMVGYVPGNHLEVSNTMPPSPRSAVLSSLGGGASQQAPRTPVTPRTSQRPVSSPVRSAAAAAASAAATASR